MLGELDTTNQMVEGEKLVEEKSMAEGHDNSSKWVVDMEMKLGDAERSVEMARWSRPSIYRVPEHIKDTTNSKAYRPVLVSLGPFHHGEPNLLPMEEHKERAVLHLVKRTGKPLAELVAAVDGVADELQSAYSELDHGKWLGANRLRFVEMMVMDGCFMLEMMRTVEILAGGGLVVEDYAPNDPVFSEAGYHNLWPDIHTDMVLIENQLPLRVMQRLITVCSGVTPSARHINNSVLYLLGRSLEEGIDNLGLHSLDIFHKSFCFCRPCVDNQEPALAEDITRSAVKLSEAGVRFRKSKTVSVRDVEFNSGVLSMPLVEVHDDSEKMYLNMMAFERLHSDAGKDVTSYIFFMDNIIDSEADVALLRAKGLVNNYLGSDKETADLFNTLGKGIMLSRYSKLGDVHHKLNVHCKKRRNRWRASFVQAYLRTPWVFISLVAAAVLLIATIIQTAYTVMSFYNKS